MGGWTPPPAPEVGSARWKDNMAFNYVVDTYKGLPPRNCVIQLPADWGFMCVRYNGSGWDYFRVEKIETQQAAPAAREPLTDEQIKAIAFNTRYHGIIDTCRAIEAAHGIGKEQK